MFTEIKVTQPAKDFRQYLSGLHEDGKGPHFHDYHDLAQYADCPARWRNSFPSLAELLEIPDFAIALGCADEKGFAATYAVPPEFVQETVLVCPGCASTGTAHRCAKCGLTRKTECHTKPYSPTSRGGRDWKAQAARTGHHPLSQARAERIIGCVNALRNDKAVAGVAAEAQHFLAISSIWVDNEDAHLRVGVRALVSAAPKQWSEQEGALVALASCMSAHPTAFALSAYRRAWHLRAALELDLANAAGLGPRNLYFIAAAEWDPPHTVARRQITPPAISAGRQCYLAALYNLARSWRDDRWPDYDSGRAGELAWSQVDPEDSLHNQSLALLTTPLEEGGRREPITAPGPQPALGSPANPPA
jgi:hypothetical protein